LPRRSRWTGRAASSRVRWPARSPDAERQGEGIGDRLSRLRAAEQKVAVEHEGRHAGDAGAAGGGCLGAHLVHRLVGAETPEGGVAVHPVCGADLGQHGGIADAAPLVEIGTERRLDHRALLVLPGRAVGRAIYALRRYAGVEHEREERDREREVGLVLGKDRKCLVEPARADPAPVSDRIRDDGQMERAHDAFPSASSRSASVANQDAPIGSTSSLKSNFG
jgi:hypothetical protein